MQFEIPIEDARGKRSYILLLHIVACFLLIITGIMEVILYVMFSKAAADKFSYFYLLKSGGIVTSCLGIILLCLLIFKNKWFSRQNFNRAIRIIEFLIFGTFSLLAWRLDVHYPAAMFGIIAFILLLALFWESASSGRVVRFNEQSILVPTSYGSQSLHWYEVQQVILRYGILTIDCVDNRLLQWNIRHATIDDVSFQEFCHAKIAASAKERSKVW